jgi:uncharacterized membrane-anchored protein
VQRLGVFCFCAVAAAFGALSNGFSRSVKLQTLSLVKIFQFLILMESATIVNHGSISDLKS